MHRDIVRQREPISRTRSNTIRRRRGGEIEPVHRARTRFADVVIDVDENPRSIPPARPREVARFHHDDAVARVVGRLRDLDAPTRETPAAEEARDRD